jgi:dihydrofolate synthase / folylpolyglutamate synthase
MRMMVEAIKTKVFRQKEDLGRFILEHVPELPERSILVVTSKIAALAEGRVREQLSDREKEKLIRDESDFAVKTKFVWMTIKDGHVLASAGIDESNAHGKLILLPKDSFKTAVRLRGILKKKYGIKNLGVIITDSSLSPLRLGTVGTALGYAGFKGLKDYRGKKDIFGRRFKFSTVNIADSLATAAVLCMGEGNERQPLALITEAPVEFKEKTSSRELRIAPDKDMFYPIFKGLNEKKKK